MEKNDQELFGQADSLLYKEYQIFLYNDDFNTFDFVINCLMIICKHEELQAKQCAMITHLKGKCCVKIGSYEELLPINNALINMGLLTIMW